MPRFIDARLSLVLIGVALVAAGCGDDGGDETEQINLIAGENRVTEIDSGKSGPSEGDTNVFASALTFADGGGDAGDLYGIQTTISVDEQTEIVQAAFTIKLADGTISVGGISEYPRGDNELIQNQEFERPIVGGTGEYSGASGTDTTVFNADGEYEHELRLED